MPATPEPQCGQHPARSTCALSDNDVRSSNANGNAAWASVSTWSSKSANVAPFSGIVSSVGITRSTLSARRFVTRASRPWRWT